jgi:hypothetical protein
MKKMIFLLSLLIVGSWIMAQTVDRTQYTETTLFDLEIWEHQGQARASQKFKATVQFSMQSGTSLIFVDTDGNTLKDFYITKRWPEMQRNQRVIIYFTATKSYGSSDRRTIDHIDF